jgi:hypothetical protein
VTDGHNAPAVVRHIVETRPEAAVLLRQLDGAAFDPAGTMVEIRLRPDAPAAPVDDGPLAGRYLVVDASGAPTGEILLWVENGLLSSAEYAWYTDDPPAAWPAPQELRVQ